MYFELGGGEASEIEKQIFLSANTFFVIGNRPRTVAKKKN